MNMTVYDGQLLDITAPPNVEVVLKEDKKVLWINIDGVCRVRICRIPEGKFKFNDRQFPGE